MLRNPYLTAVILLLVFVFLQGCRQQERNNPEEPVSSGTENHAATSPSATSPLQPTADMIRVEQETKAYAEERAAFKAEIATDNIMIEREKISNQHPDDQK